MHGKSLFLLISTAIAFFNVGTGMILPILPIYAQTYGASTFLIGLMVSSLTVGRLLMQGPGGFLADRYRDQKIVAVGIAFYVPAMLLMAFLPHPFLFVGLRLIEGSVEGAILPALYSIVAKRASAENLGSSFGIFTSFSTFGLALGPIFGGFLMSYGGPRTLFVTTAVIAALVAVFILRLPEAAVDAGEAKRREKKSSHPWKAFRELLLGNSAPTLISASLFSFLMKLAFASLQLIIPLYLANQLAAGKEVIGALFTVNFLIYSFGQPVTGWLSDKIPTKHDTLLSTTIVAVTFFVLPTITSVRVFFAVFAIEVFAAAWTTVNMRKMIAGDVDRGDLGKAYGIMGSIGDGGALSGPLVVSVLYSIHPSWPFYFIAVLTLAGTLVAALLARRSTSLGKAVSHDLQGTH